MANKMEEAAAEFEKLQAQQNGAGADDDVVVDDDTPEPKGKEAAEDKGSKKPPGFLSYDEYIKAGKDPDRYKGQKAYEDDYERIQEIKALKKEFKTFTQQVMSANEATLNKEREQMKSALEAELKRQKEEGDVDGALETKEKLTELKQEIKQGPAQINPVIQEFIEANPILDKESDEYNPKFFKTMAKLQAQEVNKLSGDGAVALDDDEIERCTRKAYEAAKEFYPELFKPKVSERNERQGLGRTAGKSGEGGKGQSFEVRLKNMRSADNRNPDMNPSPAYDMYKHIKEKYGDKAADKFARSALGE